MSMDKDNLIKALEDNQVWYSNAFEALSPIRYQLNQVLERPTFIKNGIVNISMSKNNTMKSKRF